MERVPICHISKSFVSAGRMHENQVVVLDEETDQEQPSWMQSCSSGFELKNWQIVEPPKILLRIPLSLIINIQPFLFDMFPLALLSISFS